MEEIDENTSLEDLQKMMAVALVYRVLVCVYEVSRISHRLDKCSVRCVQKYINIENLHASVCLSLPKRSFLLILL